jgi:hypothetical protein
MRAPLGGAKSSSYFAPLDERDGIADFVRQRAATGAEQLFQKDQDRGLQHRASWSWRLPSRSVVDPTLKVQRRCNPSAASRRLQSDVTHTASLYKIAVPVGERSLGPVAPEVGVEADGHRLTQPQPLRGSGWLSYRSRAAPRYFEWRRVAAPEWWWAVLPKNQT